MRLLKGTDGISIFEAVLAITIFTLLGATMTMFALSGQQGLTLGRDQTVAEGLALEAIEALKLIRSESWNELNFSSAAVTFITPPNERVHWKLNEFDSDTLVFDSTGKGWDGTVMNGAWGVPHHSWEEGRYFTSFLNTSDDYIERTIGINISSSFTIGLWVKPFGSNIEFSGIYSSDDRAKNGNFQIDVGGPGNGCTGEYRMLAGRRNTRTVLCLGPITNEWTHLAVSYDGTDIAGFYNGQEVTGSPITAHSQFTGLQDRFRLMNNRNGNLQFAGYVDDFRYHHNVALPQTDIEAMMHDAPKGEWLLHDGVTEQIGKFTRSIDLHDVCRQILAHEQIVECDSGDMTQFNDPHTKEVVVTVSWEGRLTVDNEVKMSTFISNWSSIDWEQTDWSGGEGQTTWSDVTMYDSDDGNVDAGTEVQLAMNFIPVESIENGSVEDNQFTSGSEEMNAGEIIHVSGDVFAIAWNDDFTSFVRTVTIDSDGNIGGIIDTQEVDSNSQDVEIIHVTGDVFAIVYHENSGGDGVIETITIDSIGNVATLNEMVFEETAEDDVTLDIIHIGGNVFAIGHSVRSGTRGYVTTVHIGDNGELDTSTGKNENGSGGAHYMYRYEYDSGDGLDPSMLMVDSDTIAIVYRGPGDDGWLQTYDVNNVTGEISPMSNPIDIWEYDNTGGHHPDFIQVGTNIFAVAYTDSGDGDNGKIVTFTIDDAGVITKSQIDTLIFDNGITNKGYNPVIESLGGSVYAVAYASGDDDDKEEGWVLIVEIDSDGFITDTILDQEYFSAASDGPGREPDMVVVDGDTLAFVYESDENPDGQSYMNGWLTTYNLEPTGAGGGGGGGGGGSGFETSGWLESSAFDTGNPTPIYVVEWSETLPMTCMPGNNCDIRVQIKTADTEANLSSTPWSGPGGVGDYYTESDGALVPTSHNNDQWIQYRVEFRGDGDDTPIFEDIRVNYR